MLAARAERDQIDATLVEFDDELASRAVNAAKIADLERVAVRRGDAGDAASFSDVVPVDVLMLCGIFRNVEHATVADIARAVPAMVVQWGYLIWTRGGGPPVDRRPEVRRWFIDARMPEVSFDGEPEKYGVGVNHVTAHQGAMPNGRLFTFRTAEI
ncbi:MAG TPA: hypothetical protein VGR26_08250 [Acidimicrobiales bacterium]|nr:hypothetical protein [Acidimicrobiales bacterium]